MSHWSQASIFNRFQNNCIQIYWGHELDLSRSCDVIGHVTNRSAICHFLLVSYWKRTSIANRSRDICIQIYLGHDLDLFSVTWRNRSCDHLIPQMPFPIGALLLPSLLSPAIFDIMGPTNIGVTTLSWSRYVIGHATNRSAICHFLLVSHWNRTSISSRFRDIWPQIPCAPTDTRRKWFYILSNAMYTVWDWVISHGSWGSQPHRSVEWWVTGHKMWPIVGSVAAGASWSHPTGSEVTKRIWYMNIILTLFTV